MVIDNTLLNSVIAIAKKAGLESLELYNSEKPVEVFIKADHSPVTQADLAAHELIKDALEKLLPGVPVLSEEDSENIYEVRKKWPIFWLVDPIDGTREFISHTGQFTVNIALIYQHQPILGVIYLPLKGRSYAGAVTIPSFKEQDELRTPIRIKPWEVGDEIILLTTRKEFPESLQQQLAQFGPVKITYRSSSVKFCVIAEGRADIYFRTKPIQEWDTAAGQAIIENAGGVVLDSHYEALRYNTNPYMLNAPFIVLGDTTQLMPILKKIPMFEEI
jgi:3'(2'), 5'-bisphosphate nucleotidase